MKIAPFLLIATLFNFVHSHSSHAKIKKLIEEFSKVHYEYTLLSMTLRQSDMAYLGTSELIKKLAEDKDKFVDLCMNYLVIRGSGDPFIHSMTLKQSQWTVLNTAVLTPHKAIEYVSLKEKHLNKKLGLTLPQLNLKDKHFVEHNILGAHVDSLSRIKNLLTVAEKNVTDPVYSQEFDRSAYFLYHNFFTVPVDASIEH